MALMAELIRSELLAWLALQGLILVVLSATISASTVSITTDVGKIRPLQRPLHNQEEHICSLFLYTDPFLWRHVHKNTGKEGFKKNETHTWIRRLLEKSVRHANAVFSGAEFYGNGSKIHKGIAFKMVDYRIDTDEGCEALPRETAFNFFQTDCEERQNVSMITMCQHMPECKQNGHNLFCNRIRSMRFYLHAFSTAYHGDVCLAYAFTYRKSDDFQGIAWIKGYDDKDPDTLRYFGYCSDPDTSCQLESKLGKANIDLPKQQYFRNTGVINTRMPGDRLVEATVLDVFAHELGHSLGARHDNNDQSCNPVGHDNYLMTGVSQKVLLGTVTHQLSVCSNRQIGANLDKLTCWDERQGGNAKAMRQAEERNQSAKETYKSVQTGIGFLVVLILVVLGSCVFGKRAWDTVSFRRPSNLKNCCCGRKMGQDERTRSKTYGMESPDRSEAGKATSCHGTRLKSVGLPHLTVTSPSGWPPTAGSLSPWPVVRILHVPKIQMKPSHSAIEPYCILKEDNDLCLSATTDSQVGPCPVQQRSAIPDSDPEEESV